MTARPGCTDERWDLASPETASISKVARPTIYPVQRSFMEGMEQISNGKKGLGFARYLVIALRLCWSPGPSRFSNRLLSTGYHGD